MQLQALRSFDDLEGGEQIVYIGPDKLPGDFVPPKERAQPYRFCHTYHTGKPALKDKYGRSKHLEDDHPANDAENWRRATPEERSGCETRLRVFYRPVTSDLANGSMHFGDEEHIDLVEFEKEGEGKIVGTADDGRDVVVFLGGRKEVRARPADSSRTFSQQLGYRQRLKGVTA